MKKKKLMIVAIIAAILLIVTPVAIVTTGIFTFKINTSNMQELPTIPTPTPRE